MGENHGNYYLNIVKRLLLPNPGIGKLGDDIEAWLATPVHYDGQKKLVPRGQCLDKKYEKIRADLMRTMRNWLLFAQLPDLETCSPDNLRLGAGYKKDQHDLVRIRHIALQLDQLKRGPCSGVFYPPPNADNPAPSLRPLGECQRKLVEMHEAAIFCLRWTRRCAPRQDTNEHIRKRRRKHGIGSSGIQSVNIHDVIIHELTWQFF